MEYPLYEFDGVKIYECPGKLITAGTNEFLLLYALCTKFQKFPEDGGALDQTFAFAQAAAVVEGVMAEQAEADMKSTKDR